jgi:hypothetical protein
MLRSGLSDRSTGGSSASDLQGSGGRLPLASLMVCNEAWHGMALNFDHSQAFRKCSIRRSWDLVKFGYAMLGLFLASKSQLENFQP